MTTTQAALLEALKAVEPYLDAIVCYASTVTEHPPNALPIQVRSAIAQAEAAALRAADAAQAGERAWLVELSTPGHAPQWWGFNHSPRSRGEWCADSNSAVRFARRLDAERMRLHIIAAFGFTGQHSYERSVSVTEHEWGSIAAQAGPLGDSVVCPWCLEGFTVLAPAAAQADDAEVQRVFDLLPTALRAHPGIKALRDAKVRAAQAGPAQAPLTDEQIDALRGLDTASRVRFYEHDFYVLSNFSAFNLHWSGLVFPTSEHAYHWAKFEANYTSLRHELQTAPSAHEAFKLAERNKHCRRPDWDAVKVGIMLDILRAKAEQHEYVRRKLLDTGDRELVEDSWRDDFWGWGPNRDGKNMLGRLWMQVRAELRADAHNGAQAPASTRPADASISGRRVDMVPSDDDESGFPCPNCQGSGAITVMSDNGPDAHEVEECCPHCDGRGSLDAAYEGAVKLLKAQRAETLKLSGKLWGLKHSREAREAFLLEVGEDLARWHDHIGYWKDFAARKALAAAPQAPAEQPLMLNGLSEAETAQTASVAGLTVAPAEPAAQAVRWQGVLTNDELHAAFQSKLQPGTKFTDDDLTAFALGIEWAEARATPAAREAGAPEGDTP